MENKTEPTGLLPNSEPIKSELVSEKDVWRQERETPRWKDVHGLANQLKTKLRDESRPGVRSESNPNPLAEKTYGAAYRLANAIAVLLEEPNNIMATSQSEVNIEEGDLGDAREPFARQVLGSLKKLGYSPEELRDLLE